MALNVIMLVAGDMEAGRMNEAPALQESTGKSVGP